MIELLLLDQQMENEIQILYMHFGLAVYQAQCLEKELAICFVLVKNFENSQISPLQDLRYQFENNLKKTIGNLVKKLKAQIKIDPNLNEKLNLSLAKRNWLIHDYFWSRSLDSLTKDGRQRITQELIQIQALFCETESILQEMNKNCQKKINISDKDINLALERLIQNNPIF